MTLPFLLILDDDKDAGESLCKVLLVSGLSGVVSPVVVTSEQEAKRWLLKHDPHVAVVDLYLDEHAYHDGTQEGLGGFRVLEHLAMQAPHCRSIVLTGHASVAHGVHAMELGAAAFLEKPASIAHLIVLIKDAVAQSSILRDRNDLSEVIQNEISQALVGESEAMCRVRAEVSYAAFSSQPLLLTGETGTGKGVAAALVHQLGKRAKGPLIRFQPAFGGADLITSELFGHSKGAFTGAHAERKGLLLEAHTGTLFLDEIDELSPQLQVTLLGALQEKRFRPVGANKEVISDFRLICATNQNLEELVETKKMRSDFYHRIAHLRLHLPPLRTRLEDIAPLFSQVIRRLHNSEGLRVRAFEPEALEVLYSHTWPGNVRELLSVLEGALFRAAYEERSTVQAEDIILPSTTTTQPITFEQQVNHFKKSLVLDAIRKHGGNHGQAAEFLGLDRTTVRRILARNPNAHKKLE